MAVCESRKKNTVQERAEKGPPELQFTVKKVSDLKVPSRRWKEIKLPIDILLLTVDKYGSYAAFITYEKSSEASSYLLATYTLVKWAKLTARRFK